MSKTTDIAKPTDPSPPPSVAETVNLDRAMDGWVYLCGPMTGYPQYNYPRFHDVALALRHLGIDVINPVEDFDGDTSLPRELYMRRAVENLLRASAVYPLNGSAESPGARLEMGIAKELLLPIITWEDVFRWVSKNLRTDEEALT